MTRRYQSSPFVPQQRAIRERERAYAYTKNRSTAQRLYWSAAWRALRADLLRDATCAAPGCKSPAAVVDHIVAHHGDQLLFFDRANLQALCKRCHDRKTVQQDGGFGNKPAAPAKEYDDGGDGFGFA